MSEFFNPLKLMTQTTSSSCHKFWGGKRNEPH
jgi:hypothetical protein